MQNMLIGFNNDVQYRGKTFHIQTEDRGLSVKEIETQIFHAGAILDTRIISYEDLMSIEGKDERNGQIRKLMQNTHRQLYANLMKGKYDAFAGLEPLSKDSEPSVDTNAFTPSQDRVPDSARQFEEGEDDMVISEGGDHVDINALKAKLAKMDISLKPPSSEAEDEDIPTQITSLDAIPEMLQEDASPIGRALNLNALTSSFKSVAGTKAWRGCHPPTEDLSLINLVEGFLKKG